MEVRSLSASPLLDCAGRLLDLRSPRVMGVLNVTPDSFSDGGRYLCAEDALVRVAAMVREGADIIDVGGESTRPGALRVSAAEQLDRVVPVIEAIVARFDRVVSVDTSDPEVMAGAVAAGAGMVNDISALRQPGALETAAGLGVPVVLMHMQGEPGDMQRDPQYTDPVADVTGFLRERLIAAQQAGLPRRRLLIDPGFGFGKTLEHNLSLLAGLSSFLELGVPLLVGLSRKSMLGRLTGAEVSDRLPASLAAAVMAVERGALIVRAHDVGPTVQALKVVQAVCSA